MGELKRWEVVTGVLCRLTGVRARAGFGFLHVVYSFNCLDPFFSSLGELFEVARLDLIE